MAAGEGRGENWQRKQIVEPSLKCCSGSFSTSHPQGAFHCLVTIEPAQQPRLVPLRARMDQPMERKLAADPKLNCKLGVENAVCSTLSQTRLLRFGLLRTVLEQRLRSTVIECEMASPECHTQKLWSP